MSMNMLRISNSLIFRLITFIILSASHSHANEQIAKLVDAYLASEGKPSEGNSEIWSALSNSDDNALRSELVNRLDHRAGFLQKLHIAHIAASMLERDGARKVVLRALESAEVAERPDLRHLFAESVAKVATTQDIALLKSFREPNERGVTRTVNLAIANLEGGTEETGKPATKPNVDDDGQNSSTKPVENFGTSQILSKRILVVIAIAVLGILTLLVRAFFRNRTS